MTTPAPELPRATAGDFVGSPQWAAALALAPGATTAHAGLLGFQRHPERPQLRAVSQLHRTGPPTPLTPWWNRPTLARWDPYWAQWRAAVQAIHTAVDYLGGGRVELAAAALFNLDEITDGEEVEIFMTARRQRRDLCHYHADRAGMVIRGARLDLAGDQITLNGAHTTTADAAVRITSILYPFPQSADWIAVGGCCYAFPAIDLEEARREMALVSPLAQQAGIQVNGGLPIVRAVLSDAAAAELAAALLWA
jgi:hypothetical protein